MSSFTRKSTFTMANDDDNNNYSVATRDEFGLNSNFVVVDVTADAVEVTPVTATAAVAAAVAIESFNLLSRLSDFEKLSACP